MRLFKHSLLSLAALNGSTDAFLSGDINTSMLLSWQILNNGNDLTTNQSINPLMMAQLFGDNNGGKLLSVLKIPESNLTFGCNLYYVIDAL